jgi:hypothetical protein
MTKKITIEIPTGFLKEIDKYMAKGTSPKDAADLFKNPEFDVVSPLEFKQTEEFELEQHLTFTILRAYLAGLDKGKSLAAIEKPTESKSQLPDDCKVANKEHCFLSGKCKQCEFTVPQ